MSVPKNKRAVSELEVFHSALELRKELTDLLLRDFGIKPRKRNIEMLIKPYGINDEDAKKLKDVFKHCGISDHDKIMLYDLLDNIKASEDDRNAVKTIVRKYRMSEEVLSEFPRWLIEDCRNDIKEFGKAIVFDLFRANSIYPTSLPELYERRLNQDRAIGSCYALLQELQYVIRVLPVDAQQYVRYTKLIEREIALIKGWRKSDNRILREIKKKDNTG